MTEIHARLCRPCGSGFCVWEQPKCLSGVRLSAAQTVFFVLLPPHRDVPLIRGAACLARLAVSPWQPRKSYFLPIPSSLGNRRSERSERGAFGPPEVTASLRFRAHSGTPSPVRPASAADTLIHSEKGRWRASEVRPSASPSGERSAPPATGKTPTKKQLRLSDLTE